MSGEQPAKHLDEISRHFLSSRRSGDTPAGASAEATLWLVVAECTYNRALIAAGVAEAFSQQGVRCTLVEIGSGLPNVGYYFALEPRDYLAPTLDGSRVVTGSVDSRIRFMYAIEPDRLEPFSATLTPDAPHVVVTAFRHPLGGPGAPSLSSVAAISDLFSSRGTKSGQASPDGIVVFADSINEAMGREINALFRDAYPDVILLIARRTHTGLPHEGVVETVTYPRELLREWGKRSPPSNPFFADLATRYLQVLSHRRKKRGKRANG